MQPATTITLDSISHLVAATTKSTASFFWQIVIALWSSYWLPISIFMIIFVLYELVTRNGNFHYNSKNGFSPTFNRIVGSGVYLLLQWIVYTFLHFFFGDNVYTHVWPYAIHLVVFGSTGLLLNLTGFWVYWKLPRF